MSCLADSDKSQQISLLDFTSNLSTDGPFFPGLAAIRFAEPDHPGFARAVIQDGLVQIGDDRQPPLSQLPG